MCVLNARKLSQAGDDFLSQRSDRCWLHIRKRAAELQSVLTKSTLFFRRQRHAWPG